MTPRQGQLEEDRLSAVQYIRFCLDEKQAERFEDLTTPVRVRIDHPAYACQAELPAALRASLAAGLRGEPVALRDPGVRPPPELVLFETDRVRAIASRARAHGVVEARAGEPLDEALWPELIEAVRRAASILAERHGARSHPGRLKPDGSPPRWRVFSVDEGP